jgi:hypothetical protein
MKNWPFWSAALRPPLSGEPFAGLVLFWRKFLILSRVNRWPSPTPGGRVFKCAPLAGGENAVAFFACRGGSIDGEHDFQKHPGLSRGEDERLA